MGVGTPPDLLKAMLAGVDMFDCILPTQLGGQGMAFTSTGRVRLTRVPNAIQDVPLDAACPCSTCKTFSRAYLHHLFKASEPLGPRLVSLHNLHHYHSLMAEARQAIEAGTYAAYAKKKLEAIDRYEHARRARGLIGDRLVVMRLHLRATGVVALGLLGTVLSLARRRAAIRPRSRSGSPRTPAARSRRRASWSAPGG